MNILVFLVSMQLRLAYCELRRNLGRAAAIMLLALAALAIVAWNLVTWRTLGNVESMSLAKIGDGFGFLTLVTALTSAIGTILAFIYTPGKTAISFLLPLLPTTRWQRKMSADIVVIGIGCLMSGTEMFALLAITFKAAPTGHWPYIAVTFVSIVLAGATIAKALLDLALLVLTKLFSTMSENWCRNIAGGCTVILFMWMSSSAVLAFVGHGQEWDGWRLLKSLAARMVVEPDLAGIAVVIAIPVCAIFLTILLELVRNRFPMQMRVRTKRRALLTDAAPLIAKIWLELVQWMRFPSNGASIVMLGALSGALLLTFSRSSNSQNMFSIETILAFISMLGIGSFGATRAHHWIYPLSGKSNGWVIPKLISVALLWLAAFFLIAIFMVALGTWQWMPVVHQIPFLLVELAVSCVIGLLLPVSTEQDLSNLLAETTAMVFCGMAPFVLSLIVSWIGIQGCDVAVCALVFLAAIIAYFRIAKHRRYVLLVPVL